MTEKLPKQPKHRKKWFWCTFEGILWKDNAWNRLAYGLRSELPDPAREERRLAELHGDVARVAQRVEVRPRVQPGELLEVATAADGVVVVGVFVSEVVGRRGRGRGVDGRVGQPWKTGECCIRCEQQTF